MGLFDFLHKPSGKNTQKAIKEVEKILKKSQENNNEEEKKPGHLPQTFRDIRIFSNTIRKAVDLMKQSGVNAVTKRRESEEYIEYTIKIPK